MTTHPSPGRNVGVSHAGKIFAVCLGAFIAFLVVLAMLEQLGLPRPIIGYVFVFSMLALHVGIGVVSRTMRVSEFYVAGRRVPDVFNGMAAAANWISSALFLALAGTLYTQGHEGLAFILGWSGGFVLLGVLFAPYLRKFGAYTVPDFLSARFGGGAVRALAIIVLICCSFTLTVAQIYAIGAITSRFLGLDFATAIYICLFAILFSSILGGMRATTWTQVAQYVVLIVAYLIPVAVLCAQRYGLPFPQLMYGQALHETFELQQQVLGSGLAGDGAAADAFTSFASGGGIEFFGLVLCLMVGTAALPHVLMRYFTAASVREARTSVGWSLAFIAILLVTAPAYAAFVKLEVFKDAIGTSLDALPSWIYSYGKIGLVKVCGVDAATLDAVKSACATTGGNTGLLRVSDLTVSGDAVVLSVPEIAGLPYAVYALVVVGALSAVLSTANGLLLAIANTLSHDVYYKSLDPNAPAARRLVAARMSLVLVALAAAYVATRQPADILTMAAWAFSLAAAGNFPALVLGIWWKRCNSSGAIAGIAAGFLVTLYYLVGTEYGFDFVPQSGDEIGKWFGVDSASAGLFGVPVGFIVMIVVSLLTPAPSREVQEMVEAIRRPRGELISRDRAG